MTPTSDPWSAYLRLQSVADTITHCSAREYAFDAVLAHILEALARGLPPESPAFAGDSLQRVMATAARRYRSRYRKLRSLPPSPAVEIEGKTEATLQLVYISEVISTKDCAVLAAVGQGYTDREIAQRHGGSPGAVRAKVARLRQKLAA